MSERRIDGFFYGLFMDPNVLRDSQVLPTNPRPGYVEGYGLRIGRRSTLVPASGERAYGMVFALTHDELERLYAPPGLAMYRPEAVRVHTLAGETYPALCYNLPEAPNPDEANEVYAARLRETLLRLGFPAESVASIL